MRTDANPNTSPPTPFFRLLAGHLLVHAVYLSVFLGFYWKFWYRGEPSMLESQITLARVFLCFTISHMLVALWLHRARVRGGWEHWMGSPTSPMDLAIFRILFLSAVVWDMQGWAFRYGLKWTSLPRSQMKPLPFLGWLQEILPVTPGLYSAVALAASVLLLLGVVGLFTRVALWLYLPLGFYIWAVPCFYGKLNHNQLMLWFPLLLAVSRCSDVLSLDSLWRRWRQPAWKAPPKSARYGIPLRFVLLLLGVIYFWAGFYKLWDSGFDWALSNSMISQFQLEWAEHYGRLPPIRIDRWPLLCKLGGLSVIYFEMLFLFLLFHPGARALLFAVGLSFHHGTSMFLYIDFMMIRRTYLAFVPWFAIRAWLSSRLGLAAFEEKESSDGLSSTERYRRFPRKLLWWTGCVLLVVNFGFGMFKTHSFPFSAYPNYSSLVGNRYKSLEILAWDDKGELMLARLLGSMTGFRQENILPLQHAVMEAWRSGNKKLARKRARDYFRIWKSHVGPLVLAVRVKIYYRETYLAPEKRNVVLKQFLITEFTQPAFFKRRRAPKRPTKAAVQPQKRATGMGRTTSQKKAVPAVKRKRPASTRPSGPLPRIPATRRSVRSSSRPATAPVASTTRAASRPTRGSASRPATTPTSKPTSAPTSRPASAPTSRPTTRATKPKR